MPLLKRVRTLKNVGVLADRSAKDAEPTFLRYNLIYGFNGSGKSTFSRLLFSLQTGALGSGLPEGGSFELEMDDGGIYGSPTTLTGLQERVCVFNSDFVDRNLRWAEGKANSIFSISQEQAEAVEELKMAEAELPSRVAKQQSASAMLNEMQKGLANFKKTQARSIAARLHFVGRKYEAPQIQADYDSLSYDNKKSLLSGDELESREEMAKRSSALPEIPAIALPETEISELVQRAVGLAKKTISNSVISELEAHPLMVTWARAGHQYHAEHNLSSCLLCGEGLSESRKALLAAMFNDALSNFVGEVNQVKKATDEYLLSISTRSAAVRQRQVVPDLVAEFMSAIEGFEALIPQVQSRADEVARICKLRQASPTVQVETELTSNAALADLKIDTASRISAINSVFERHNTAVADFENLQTAARVAIRRHFLAEGHDDYLEHKNGEEVAKTASNTATEELDALKQKIENLRSKVRQHGPAAEVITKLVRAYLGHGELTIVAAEGGYELHRHGKIVKGPPSEGEKTALALCYFLTTLESDGRKLKDLIVLVDDPISSLDTKAMNYACSLIRSRLKGALQLFVLTHNQHFMNEFKKDWRALAKADKPTATLLFLDAKVPSEGAARVASLVPMPGVLRAYDSEYHYLCQLVFQFDAAGNAHFEYAFLMPNVIRKVLEIFLAFKVPGSAPPRDKIAELSKAHPGIDMTRLVALERLVQSESHSDSLDDLVSHSSMTIEETRDANAALILLMNAADSQHLASMRRYCA